jgi:Tfp pilus assembly protein PilO
MVLFVSIALFCASVSALLIFVYKLETQKAAYREVRIHDAEETARRASFATLTETFDRTETARETLAAHILTDAQVVDFLGLIETLGRETGVLLSTDSLTTAVAADRFEWLTASISVEGSYASVLRTLELLETLPYEARIEQVSLGQEANGWRGTFNIRVLKFK